MESETSSYVNHGCDLCGSNLSVPLDPAVICQNCGFLYVVQRRPSEEIAQAWDDLWGEAYSSKWPAVVARQHYVAEWCDQIFGWADKAVLDIGAGEGQFIRIIDDYGAIPCGIDPDPKHSTLDRYTSAERSEFGIHDIFTETIETYETHLRYDVVTILWTLENCGDCIGMLKKARSLLRPGGRIVVATGSRILVPFKKPLSSYFSDNPPDLHCFRFSANTLQAALSIAGLPETQTNSYMDSDWLVCVGREGRSTPASLPYDRPEDVQRFFSMWRRTFP